MTTSRFDPRALALYEKPPELLHFEFGNDGLVYRYVMLQSFKPSELDEDTRRTKAERALHMTHAEIRRNLFMTPE